VDFDEILYGSDDVEDDMEYLLLNVVASTIPKWRTFDLLRWAQILNLLVDLDEIFYGVMSLNIVYCKLMYGK
jgi:hypothetical protein